VSALTWPTGPAGPELVPLRPGQVWVAVLVVTAEVSFRDRPATGQLTSVAALFAPARTETRTSARIVAAAVSEAECRAALHDWREANPGVQGEEVVSLVALGRAPVGLASVSHDQPNPAPRCISCSAPIAAGFRCGPCTQAYWAQLRAQDQDLAAP
jgi:hypothetical protein